MVETNGKKTVEFIQLNFRGKSATSQNVELNIQQPDPFEVKLIFFQMNTNILTLNKGVFKKVRIVFRLRKI